MTVTAFTKYRGTKEFLLVYSELADLMGLPARDIEPTPR
jgi:hypothetical protein